jgi:hypothetical protein
MEKIMLLSVLGIVTTNLSICFRGITDSSNLSVIDEPLKERIKLIAMSLIENPQTDDAGREISRLALMLFITGMEILFPSEWERCSILLKYLENFVRGTLSDLEKSVLESLMRQTTNVRFLSKVLSKKVSTTLNPNDLLKTLLTVVKRGIIVQFGAISLGTYSRSFGGIMEAAMKLLLLLSNVMFSARAQYLISMKVDIEEAKSVVGELIIQSKAVTETCLEIFDTAFELNSKVGISRDSRYIMNPFIEEVLRQSPVCELLPLIADCLHMIAPRFILSFNQLSFFAFADNIRAILSVIAKFSSFAPKNFIFPPVILLKRPDEEFVYESEHPYLPNTMHYSAITFPGAKKIIISFSSQSRTESSNDFVSFYKNSRHDETWHGAVKFSGRDGSDNWPGVGGHPPLEIDGDTFDLHFRSGGGNNQDWGWKFTARVEFKNSFCVEESHWLIDLEQRLVNLLSGYAYNFVSSCSEFNEIESSVSIWLNSGFYKKDTQLSDSVVATSLDLDANRLLTGLLSATGDPLANELSKLMRENVAEDRGNNAAIDLAVRATCALLIKVCTIF